MKVQEAKNLEKRLTEKGYTKYSSCLTSTVDYAYFKSGDITYDEYGEKHVGYQVAFRFWDWTKYGTDDIGVDIIFITSTDSRVDLILTAQDYDIDKIEKVGEDFYQFTKEHKLI